jgi:hypothetical protein
VCSVFSCSTCVSIYVFISEGYEYGFDLITYKTPFIIVLKIISIVVFSINSICPVELHIFFFEDMLRKSYSMQKEPEDWIENEEEYNEKIVM